MVTNGKLVTRDPHVDLLPVSERKTDDSSVCVSVCRRRPQHLSGTGSHDHVTHAKDVDHFIALVYQLNLQTYVYKRTLKIILEQGKPDLYSRDADTHETHSRKKVSRCHTLWENIDVESRFHARVLSKQHPHY